MPRIEVVEADLARVEDQRAIVALLDAYARDPMGNGAPLAEDVLLEAIAEKGRELGCCKVTLEVQENNQRARRVYQAAGFSQATYLEEAGGALFMSKPL